MRVTNLLYKNVSSGTTLLQEQPGYDAVNNVVSVSATLPQGTDNQQFCYDNLNRMTWSGSTGTPPCATFTAGTLTSAQYQESDAFNTEGQLTTGPAGGYTYGDSKHPHTVTAASNGYTASYDLAGNMICRALTSATTCNGTQTGQQLGYDPEGRLSTWQDKPSLPGSTANFLYDGEGNRVATQTTSAGNTTTTAYIGNSEEVQSTTGSSAQITTYYYIGGVRLGANVGGTFYYFGYDILGSQVLALSSSGSVAGEQLFSPYGNKRYTYGTLPTSIGFTGQRSDSVTGLDYYVARYYDPAVGQFISPDSVQGNPQGTSPYAYVKCNPETLNDPTGHWGIGQTLAVVGASIGLVGLGLATVVVGATVGTVAGTVVGLCAGGVPGAVAGAATGSELGGVVGGWAGIGMLEAGMSNMISTLGEDALERHDPSPQEIFASAFDRKTLINGAFGGPMDGWKNFGLSTVGSTVNSFVDHLQSSNQGQDNSGGHNNSGGHDDGGTKSPLVIKNTRACGNNCFGNYQHASKSLYSNFAHTQQNFWNHYQHTIYNLWLQTTNDVSQESMTMFESVSYYHANKLISLGV